jgi:hypothetical protein
VNVLHLVDPGEAGGGALTLRFLADLCLARHANDAVIVFGHREHARLAQRCGVRVDGLMAFPRTARLRVPRALAALVSAMEGAHGRFDLVHAWSARTGGICARLLPDRPSVVSAMVGPQRQSLVERVAWAHAASVSRAAPRRVLAANESVAGELLLAGADPGALLIVEPGVDVSLLREDRQPSRLALRQRWDVDDETLLVGLISQPISWGDARAAASIVTLPVTANRNVKLLVHPNATRLQAAYEWARPLELDRCLIQDPDLAEPWRVLAGIDVALWLGNERTEYDSGAAQSWSGRHPLPGLQPILWALAAGLPVIAERCAAVSELIRDGENGILIEPGDVPAGAKNMTALHDDANVRRSLGQAAQRIVAAQFTIARAAQRVGQVYDELLNGTPENGAKVATSQGRSETAVAHPAVRS